MRKFLFKTITKKLTSIFVAAAVTFGILAISDTKLDVKAAFTAPYYNINDNGGSWDGNNYILDGNIIKDAFFCDGTYTYFLQADGTPMKDRLTYHPDGEHVIYFDSKGHEVFSNFANVKKSIAGDVVDDLCFFDVYGYMYTNVLTYNQDGTALYYANPYGVMERSGWFQFAEGAGGVASPLGATEGKWGYAYTNGVIEASSIGDESVKNSYIPSKEAPVVETTVDDVDVKNDEVEKDRTVENEKIKLPKGVPAMDTDWKKAYNSKLSDFMKNGDTFDGTQSYKMPAESYFLYDMDKDGIPELCVRFGESEADYFLKIFSYLDSKVVERAAFGCGHTSFYSSSNKEIITEWSHMNGTYISRLWFTDSGYSTDEIWDVNYNNNPDIEDKSPEDFIEGSKLLTEFKLNTRLPLSGYGISMPTSKNPDNDDVHKKINEVINNNEYVHLIIASRYNDKYDKDKVRYDTLFKKGTISKYDSYVLINTKWGDLNGDGQDECILLLGLKETSSDCNIVVLSLQDGVVYAYADEYYKSDLFVKDNIIYYDEGKLSKIIVFYKYNAYTEYTY